MADFTTWTELENYLTSTSDTDLIINLDMQQNEASNESNGYAVKLINFPDIVNSCILSSSDTTIKYNTRITTNISRTSYFELTILNLNIEINKRNDTTENYTVIDIASTEYLGSPTGTNYNILNFSGTNTIDNIEDGSLIHISGTNGLYINLMENSNTTLGTIIYDFNKYAAVIGGNSSTDNGEDGGNIFIYGAGDLTINSYLGTGIGGGYGNLTGGNGGNIRIYGDSTITIKAYMTSIGGGYSSDATNNNGIGGTGGNISIYDSANVSITKARIAIGGGYGLITGGDGGNIRIYGESTVSISDDIGVGIGAGTSYYTGGNSGDIYIYDSANVSISDSSVGIGGGLAQTGGNVNNISIYGSAIVSISDDIGVGIGAGFGIGIEPIKSGNGGIISIYENSTVSISNSNFGIAAGIIYKNRIFSTDGTGTGTITISTTNPLTISSSDLAIALGLNKDSNISITSSATMDILGGIQGGHLTIENQKLIVNKLIYKYINPNDSSDTGSLTFDNGYIVVNNANHEEYPENRPYYFIITLTNNGDPYTSEVTLEKISDNSSLNSTNNFSLLGTSNDKILPDSNGQVQIYISNGNYYFNSTDQLNRSFQTEPFNITSTTTEDIPLVFNEIRGTIQGSVNYLKDSNYIGAPNVLVSLYDEKRNITNYNTLTDATGNYSFNDLDLGNYYVAFSNVPNDHLFVVDDNSDVMETGVTKTAVTLSADTPILSADAVLKFNEGIIGAPGAAGVPGRNGSNFPSSSINMFQPESQIATKASSINLGQFIEGNGIDINYSSERNSFVLNTPGTYMVNYNVNANYINEHSSDDYLGLQLKLGNDYLQHGFSYIRDNGSINGSSLVRSYGYRYPGSNELQLINVGSQDMYLDNLTITIFRTS